MKEMLAYFTLIVEERDRLAGLPGREHRSHTSKELESLVALDQAITALLNADRSMTPPAAVPPDPTGPGSDYRLVAEKHYSLLADQYKFSMVMSGEFGKWLVATISAVMLGGIFFIGGLHGVSLEAKEPALWTLVVGAILNLAAGFVAYWNWGYNARLLAKWTHPDMLVLREKWPKEEPELTKWIAITFRIAIFLGLLSVATIPLAAYLLTSAS